MPRRTSGGKSKSVDTRPVPRPVAAHKPIEQKIWRRQSLLQRALRYAITDKNRVEAQRLGLQLV